MTTKNSVPVVMPASRVLFDEATIGGAIDHMADAIRAACGEEEWVLVCVLNGGLMLASEIMKRLHDVNLRLDTVRVSRYHETVNGSVLQFHTRPGGDLKGRNVLLVDDIFDEGKTLAALVEYFRNAEVAGIVTAVLLDKSHDRKSAGMLAPDIVGLTCPDAYVFGFGMDYEGRYRNLPVIRCLLV